MAEIIKAIGAGAGKVYEPASIYFNERANGAADRHNAIADAKAYLDLRTRSPAVLDAMKDRILGIEYHRQENIIDAEREAIGIAQDKQSRETREIHPDFMVEWMEGVKDVSDDMVRHFWAHLLAEAPSTEAGRVPKPVVDFLKLLDRELCELLQYLYCASLATNGRLFDEALRHSMAGEIGLGSVIRSGYFETSDRTLKMDAHAGDFPLFEMGARATMLCEIAFPVADEKDSLRNFYKSLPGIMRGIRYSSTVSHVTIEVRDSQDRRHLFDLQVAVNEAVKPRRHSDAAGVMRDMKLEGKACADELRAGISEIADWLEYRGSENIHRLSL